MTLLQGSLFAALMVMVLAWFAGLKRLSRLLRERHARKYEELDLAELFPKWFWASEHDNSIPVRHLLLFLWRREYHDLGDREVATLGAYLRLLFIAYVVVFALLFGSIVRDGLRSGFSGNVQATTPPAMALREKALELHRQKKYAEAVAAYDQLLGDAGADPELVYYRGGARWNLGDVKGAQADFRRVIELDPGHYEAHVRIDRYLSQQKRFDECIRLWNGYLKVAPRDANAYFERSGSYFHRGDRDSALADAKRACDLGKAAACPWVERLQAARP